MLVMMFFNWRIYRTARKTTRAIRQGWTKVKGVGGGDDEIGMGIHRGGSHSSSIKKANTVVTSNGMVGTKIATGSTRSSSFMTNGVSVAVARGSNGQMPSVGHNGKPATARVSANNSSNVKSAPTANGTKPRINSIHRSGINFVYNLCLYFLKIVISWL